MHPRHAALIALAAGALALATGCSDEKARSDEASVKSSSGYHVGWRQIRRGMTPDEVYSALGEPERVKVAFVTTYWYYSDTGTDGPHVSFDTREMTVSTWQTP